MGPENHGLLIDRMAVSQDARNRESAGQLLGFRPTLLPKPPLKEHAAWKATLVTNSETDARLLRTKPERTSSAQATDLTSVPMRT